MNNRWFAIYLFYPGDLDLMLSQLVAPFIKEFFPHEQQDIYYFFIRYWENGSHIRLRINADSTVQEVLAEELKKMAHAFFIQYPGLSQSSSFNKETLFADHYIQFAVYEPETERYGNQQSLLWAETHFFKSSVFILNWINTKKPGASVLIQAQALRMHLILLFAISCDIPRLIAICNFFIEGWLPRLYNREEDTVIQERYWLNEFEISFNRTKEFILPASRVFWDKLATGTADRDIQDLLNVNIQILQNYQSVGFEETKLTGIITSMMHMNNNRLGISNYEEAYGMYCTRQCLIFLANY
ncbi:thiopeptide-type bacteriocin biosynthesis protein [Pedobacter sp. NJ-S-72]